MKKKQKEPETKTVLASSLESLADNIFEISQIGEALKNSSLSRRAVVLLIKDLTNMYITDIEKVLDAIPRLEKTYLK